MERLSFQAEQTRKLRDKGLPSKATWMLPGRVGRVEMQRSRGGRVLGGGGLGHIRCDCKNSRSVSCFAKTRTRA